MAVEASFDFSEEKWVFPFGNLLYVHFLKSTCFFPPTERDSEEEEEEEEAAATIIRNARV